MLLVEHPWPRLRCEGLGPAAPLTQGPSQQCNVLGEQGLSVHTQEPSVGSRGVGQTFTRGLTSQALLYLKC